MGSKPNISSFTIIVTFLCIALAGIAFVPLLPIKLSPSRTLLYQTPDNISEISITPDDRHIILKTQEATVRNAFVYDTESDEPMVSTLFKYTIVVLEL